MFGLQTHSWSMTSMSKGKFDLDQIIYQRNILDRFPHIPPYLALRLAKVNADRAKRLAHAHETNLQKDLPLEVERTRQRSASISMEAGPFYLSDAERIPEMFRNHKPSLSSQRTKQILDSLPDSSFSFWSGEMKSSISIGSQSNSSGTNDSMQTPDQDVGLRSKSLDTHSWVDDGSTESSGFVLPPPPIDLGTENTFRCDICDRQVIILRRRDWQYVCHWRLSDRELTGTGSMFCKTCNRTSVFSKTVLPDSRYTPRAVDSCLISTRAINLSIVINAQLATSAANRESSLHLMPKTHRCLIMSHRQRCPK